MRILQMVREQGNAVVMVTHNMSLLSEFPGIVYRCENGAITEATNDYNSPMEVTELD